MVQLLSILKMVKNNDLQAYFSHILFMNWTVLCISSMHDGLSTLMLHQKYRGLKNHVKSANVSLLKTRQHVKSKDKTKRQKKRSKYENYR